MNLKILNLEVQKFINANLKTDLHSLLLKKTPFEDVSMLEIVQQIKGKNVAAKKFPYLLRKDILFPPHLNLEQSSSETTALYKSNLFQGESFIDLTSGFAIDAFYLSKNFKNCTLVERNKDLLNTVQHNWEILNKKATFINQDLTDFLKVNTENFDLIYIDPARRDENKNKVFLLEDLSPNLLDIQDKLLTISNQILIKLSPLIDLSYLISVLQNISKIYIIAVKNEVKEILVLIDNKTVATSVEIICSNLESGEKDFKYNFEEESLSTSEFTEALKYLYIPNNTILKAGAFNILSKIFNLKKLHPNSHFYFSEDLIPDFPGRLFTAEIFDSKMIKKGESFNIISKNYPLKPEEIKRKYQIKDGGEDYLIFTQTLKEKLILKCKKLNY